AAGLVAASTTTGSRMLPSTRPTRPPASAVTKHQTATAARRSASRRLNITHDRTNAPSERVDPTGPVGGSRAAQGPSDRVRDDHRRGDLAGPATRARVRLCARSRAQARADDCRTAGGARGPAGAHRG